MSRTDPDGLTPRQRTAIAALLASRNVGQAAKAANVGQRSLFRWLREPVFRAALLQAEADAVAAATRRLVAGQDQALDTLLNLMQHAESENVRRQAASDWLSFLIRVRELAGVELRLAALERLVAQRLANVDDQPIIGD